MSLSLVSLFLNALLNLIMRVVSGSCRDFMALAKFFMMGLDSFRWD